MKLIDILTEVKSVDVVYRGVNPAYGDVGLGINSTKIGGLITLIILMLLSDLASRL